MNGEEKLIEVDAIIYAPLEAEYLGAQRFFKPIRQIDGSKYTGFFSEKVKGKSIIVVVGFEWGNSSAQEVWREVLCKYQTKVAICVGIAGAVSKDAQLGHVYFATNINDLTQRAKVEEDTNGNVRTAYDPISFNCDESICTRLNRRRMSIEKESAYRIWQRNCKLRNSAKVATAKVSHLERPGKSLSEPVASPGTIASVNTVIASKKALADVKNSGRKVMCVDTESAGFIRELSRHPKITTLVVRGISDFADAEKSLLEDNYSELFREIAISNAVSFLHHNFLEIFDAPVAQPELNLTNGAEISMRSLEVALNENEESNRSELYDRSILYKTIGAHESMPVPRLKFNNLGEAVSTNATVMEAEIETVLQEHNVVLAEVPISYPDNALPWLYASVISRANINDRLTIPVVVDWNRFGPPRNSLQALLVEMGLSEVKDNSSYQIVFIFPQFLLGSSSKSKYLKEEIAKFSNAKFLVFSKSTEDTPYNNNFVTELNPEIVSVQGISFSALTRYVNTFLEIELSEAEVLAKRLLSTFNDHRLKMHPTYLASINKDTLTSFLEANHRGELIEITVAALLTLLVAGDDSDVVLRRTAREDFLSDLAVDIYAKKINYTRVDLETHVQKIAKHMGFAITPQQFINSFEASGVLNFDSGFVQFTVPIIKSYMLAKGLLLDELLAKQYFDFDDELFDYNTFDLFCEYSRSIKLLPNLLEKMAGSIDFFDEKINKYPDPVKNGDFKSRLLSKTLNLRELTSEMSGKAQKLVESTSLTSEKQAIIDVQEQVSQTETARDVSVTDSDKFKFEWLAVRHYSIATVLLGAAAERLENLAKIELVETLLKLGDKMITDLLTLRSMFDFDKAVVQVCSSMIKEHSLVFENIDEENDFKEYVNFIVADWDYQHALNTILMFTNTLCETGRTNVLLTPIGDAKPENALQEFLRTSWAFDMDPKKERARPKKLSKSLGRAPFVRVSFATLFYYRSYWYHAKIANRQAIADGVNVVLERVSASQEMPVDRQED